jgi:hypothetical protein
MTQKIIHNINYKNFSKQGRKLLRIDKNGKIYIPSLVRKIFRDCHFYLEIEGGKLVLDPVKVEDVFEEEVE